MTASEERNQNGLAQDDVGGQGMDGSMENCLRTELGKQRRRGGICCRDFCIMYCTF